MIIVIIIAINWDDVKFESSCETAAAEPVLALFIANKVMKLSPITIVFKLPNKTRNSFLSCSMIDVNYSIIQLIN